MKARAAAPDVLVDLNGLDELRTIGIGADGSLELGAMATYTSIMQSPEVHATRPVIAEVAGMIADVQVRNRGTIGGNVCTGDPTNHYPPLMVALGAEMTVRGSDGERSMPAEEFFLGVYMTEAGPGELLTRITIPAADGAGTGSRSSPSAGTAPPSSTPPPACARTGRSRRRAWRSAASTPCPSAPRSSSRASPAGTPQRARSRTRPGGSAPRSTRPRTSTPPPTTAGTLPRSSRPAPSSERPGRPAGEREPVTSAFVTVTVNGTTYEREVDARRLLVHFLRDDLDLTGTHIGCDTGNCGACTILFNGQNVKSCMLLAVQADGPTSRRSRASPATANSRRSSRRSRDTHALQCGYCTPGMLISATALLRQNPRPTEDEIRKALQGNLCRCTGYVNIVEAVKAAAKGGPGT